MIEHIHWLGHSSFRVNGPDNPNSPTIYIDPWRITADSPPADIILISHDHHDHFSPDDIEKIRTPDTLIISNQRVAGLYNLEVQILRPWQGAINHMKASIRAIPAYTIDKAYHDKSYGGLGFLISVMRHDIYFAGDTDLIPEMDKIGCDIAILPVGGAFTMNYEEAAEAAKRINPLYAIPMHYGREVPGSKDDGKRFCQIVKGNTKALELPIENTDIIFV